MADSTRRRGPKRAGVRAGAFDLIVAHGPDVASLCRAGPVLVPGSVGVGVSVGAGCDPGVRFTGDRVGARLESAQAELGEGPGRDAAEGGPVFAADLADGVWRRRWPRFTRAALAAGVRAVCALPLHAGGVRHDGAVDVYRKVPGDWDDAGRVAAMLAAAAAELLTLQRLDLDLHDAFTAGRAGGAGGCSGRLPAGPLAFWFDYDTLPAVRTRVGLFSAAHDPRCSGACRFVLGVHEAMTNAVRHGGGRGQVVLWYRDGRLWCEISDHGPGIRTGRSASPAGAGAWPELPRYGLWLIRQACPDVEITTDPTGTRVRLSYRLFSEVGWCSTGRCGWSSGR